MTTAINVVPFERGHDLASFAEGIDVTDEERLDELVDALLSRVEQRSRQRSDANTLSGAADVTIGVMRDRVKRLQEDVDGLKGQDHRHDDAINGLTLEVARLRTLLELRGESRNESANFLRSGKVWAGALTAVGTAVAAAIAWLSGKGS